MSQKPRSRTGAVKASGVGGIKHIITQTDPSWNIIWKRLGKLGRTYGFQRVETPVVDDSAVFESYYKDIIGALPPFTLQIGDKVQALRPTILPQVLKSYVTQKVVEQKPLSKWLYAGNVIRPEEEVGISDYEFGFEVLGTFTHLVEAQTIAAVWQLVQGLELSDTVLEINTAGDAACQATYSGVLRDFLSSKKFELCDNCNEALSGRVLDVLRCSNMECQVAVAEAPTILDFLDENSQKQFTCVLEALDELQIPYQLNPLLVGPAGTSLTTWVVRYKKGSRIILIGEGSYHEALMKQIAGKGFPCFGFQGSLGAMHQVMQLAETQLQPEIVSEVFLVPLGELASKKSLRLFHDLTAADVRVYDHFGTVGVKNQLKQAEEFKSPIALIMGQKEAMDEMVILRDVKSGMQELFSYDKIVIEVKKRLGR